MTVDGYTAACVDGKWGFYDDQLRNPTHFEYDEATAFVNGIAAVKKNGKWAIINTEFKTIIDFKFTDVIVDSAGACSRKGLIFADDGNGYGLYDLDGKRIGNQVFDDAKPFRDDLAAVCKDGKWGYINASGELVIDYRFDDADSFMQGVAPACTNGQWGFINTDGEFVVEPTFESASVVSPEGVAFVGDNGKYRYIRFVKFTV